MRYLLSIVGQSNERGWGDLGTASRVAAIGAPYIDGDTRKSMWPRVIERMGQRGHWLDIANTAQGATSLCDTWVGRCRQWQAGAKAVWGSYMLSDGGLWRCNAISGATHTLANAPTGTADVTGADGCPWVYVGPQTAEDVVGNLYQPGSSRFDPYGFLAAALDAHNNRPGYDDKGVYFAIGQTDHSVSSSRAQFSQAIQIVANLAMARGLKFFCGFTCHATTTGRDAWFQSDLMPGRLDAIAALSGNASFRLGANLRELLGVLQDNQPADVVGLRSDLVHLTTRGYDAAGEHVAAALAASGW